MNNNFEETLTLVEEKRDTEKEQPSMEDVLKKIPREELETYFLVKLSEKRSFSNEFKSYFSQYFDIDPEQYLGEWEEILYHAMGRYGYITYDQAYAFQSDTATLIQKMDAAAQYHPAVIFNACITMYQALVDFPIDDSNNTTGDIASDLQTCITTCVHHADSQLKERIQAWIIHASEDSDLCDYCLEEGLRDVYIETLSPQDQIDYLIEEGYCDADITKLLSLLISQSMEEDEIYSLMENKKDSDVAKEWMIAYNSEHNRIQETIDILLYALQEENRYNNKYYIQLLHIYDQHGYEKEYHELAKKFLSTKDDSDLMIYKEFRRHFKTCEWDTIKGEIIENMKYDRMQAECYAFESMTDELMTFMETKSFSFQTIKDYEELLLNKHENRLLEIYQKEIEKLCEKKNNDAYTAIFLILQHMFEMPHGKKLAHQLCEMLKETYRIRRNLMKLLKELPQTM